MSSSLLTESSCSFLLPLLNNAINHDNIPVLFSSVSGTNLRAVRLKIDPNPMAITVHTKQITLYGILKSGVAIEMSNGSVCILIAQALCSVGG